MGGWWPSTKKRLEAKLDKSGGSDSCWIWQGSTASGYGQIMHNGKMTRTHRVAYELEYGEIPEGMDVCHNCPNNQDNPLCCNPVHMFLGTHTDNIRDMERKGRANHPKGEATGTYKLVTADVIRVREMAASGVKLRDIAKEYGVTPTAISFIVSRKTWKHVA